MNLELEISKLLMKPNVHLFLDSSVQVLYIWLW